MDYRKIIKSRKVRFAILRLLRFVPDRAMLKLQYRIQLGRRLNLKKPRRYTEKIQWYKLYYKDPLMIQCVDKYDIRSYVESKGLGKYLNRCYGVYDKFEEIDFSSLPERFVIKDTLGGGGISVIFVKNKETMEIDSIKKLIDGWTKTKIVRDGGREWPYYSGKKHRIIVEDYLEESGQFGLIDYKFNCFYGEVSNLMVYLNRKQETSHTDTYDSNFNLMDVKRIDSGSNSPNEVFPIEKPYNFEEMKRIASILSSPFPHARVDLYNIDGRIVFGEVTFYPSSGYTSYLPDSFDFSLGDQFVLPSKRSKKHL